MLVQCWQEKGLYSFARKSLRAPPLRYAGAGKHTCASYRARATFHEDQHVLQHCFVNMENVYEGLYVSTVLRVGVPLQATMNRNQLWMRTSHKIGRKIRYSIVHWLKGVCCNRGETASCSCNRKHRFYFVWSDAAVLGKLWKSLTNKKIYSMRLRTVAVRASITSSSKSS